MMALLISLPRNPSCEQHVHIVWTHDDGSYLASLHSSLHLFSMSS